MSESKDFLYKGHSLIISIPHSKKLKFTLSALYEREVTPILVRLFLTRFKHSHAVLWQEVIEVDETDDKHIYPNMLAEFILPGLDHPEVSPESAKILLPERDSGYTAIYELNLLKQMEFEFAVPDLDLPTKQRKDGLLLRDKAPEDGGRVIYRLQDAELQGISYL